MIRQICENVKINPTNMSQGHKPLYSSNRLVFCYFLPLDMIPLCASIFILFWVNTPKLASFFYPVLLKCFCSASKRGQAVFSCAQIPNRIISEWRYGWVMLLIPRSLLRGCFILRLSLPWYLAGVLTEERTTRLQIKTFVHECYNNNRTINILVCSDRL